LFVFLREEKKERGGKRSVLQKGQWRELRRKCVRKKKKKEPSYPAYWFRKRKRIFVSNSMRGKRTKNLGNRENDGRGRRGR